MLSFDIDGVLVCASSEAFIQVLPTYGIPFDQEVFSRTHCWNQATGLSTQALGRLYTLFLKSMVPTASPPLPGAVEAIQVLRDVSRLMALTARSQATRQVTMQLLNEHFDDAFQSAWFGAAGNKHVAVLRRAVTVHVDDSIKEARQIAHQVGTGWVILFPNFDDPVQSTAHQRIIELPVSREAVSGVASTERESLYRQAWSEVCDTILNLVEMTTPPSLHVVS